MHCRPIMLECQHFSTSPRVNIDIVNGERNQMWLNIENNLGKNVTLLTAAGEFRHPDSDKTLKAVCIPSLHLLCYSALSCLFVALNISLDQQLDL